MLKNLTVNCGGATEPILTVNLTNPTNGQVYPNSPTNILLQTSVTDIEGNVTNVSFHNNGTLLGVVTDSPFRSNGCGQMSWQAPTCFTLRRWTISATPHTAGTNTFYVYASPYIVIQTPTNHAPFTETANVTLTALATNFTHDIATVQFFNFTNRLGTVTNLPGQRVPERSNPVFLHY